MNNTQLKHNAIKESDRSSEIMTDLAKKWYESVSDLWIVKERFHGAAWDALSDMDRYHAMNEFKEAVRRIKHSSMGIDQWASLINVDGHELNKIAQTLKPIYESQSYPQVDEAAESKHDALASAIVRELINNGQAVEMMKKHGSAPLVAAIDSVTTANLNLTNPRSADLTRLIGQVNNRLTGSEIAEDMLDDPNATDNPAQSKPANPTQANSKPADGFIDNVKQAIDAKNKGDASGAQKALDAAKKSKPATGADLQKQKQVLSQLDKLDELDEDWKDDLIGLAAAAGIAAGAYSYADSGIKDYQNVAGENVKHFRGVLNVDARPLAGYHTSFYGKPAVVWTGKTKQGQEMVFWNYVEDPNSPTDKDLNVGKKKPAVQKTSMVKEEPAIGDQITLELADGRAIDTAIAEVRGNSIIVDLDETAQEWLASSPTHQDLMIGNLAESTSNISRIWNSMVTGLEDNTPSGWAKVMIEQNQTPDRWSKIWRLQHEQFGSKLSLADQQQWLTETELAMNIEPIAEDTSELDPGIVKLRNKLDDKDNAMLAVWIKSHAGRRKMEPEAYAKSLAMKLGYHKDHYWMRVRDLLQEGDVPPGRQMSLVNPEQRWGLANPRIIWVGDDPQGVRPYKTVSFDPLNIGTFSQWNNEQHHARNKGYQLRYIGMDKKKRRESQWMGEDPVSPRVLADQPKPEPKYKDNVLPFRVKTDEAEYHGRKVQLGKPIRTNTGEGGKFKVYVRDPKTGNIKMVRFGDTTGLSIKRDDPNRRKSFRARHHCDNPGPRTKARYWSCRMWTRKPVSKVLKGK